jgi:signal transduction histidine kinase
VTVVLLVLLPTLAVLQYRWVGQVSEAERDRMQTHVRNSAVQFRDTLDGELARAVINLQVGAATARDGFSDRYTDRYDAWLATAAHPQVVAGVFLVDADEQGVQIRHWNPTAHAFEVTAWPAPLEPFRQQFEQDFAALRAGRAIDRRLPAGMLEESLVISPLRPPPPGPGGQRADGALPFYGFTVLQLDLNYIRTQMLPELSQRYFSDAGGSDGYRVVVTSAFDPETVIYRSDPKAAIDPDRADVVEPIFGMRGDVFLFNRGNGRGDGRRTVGINIVRGRDGEPNARVLRPFDRDFGRWTLIAQHRTGSLDAAVARARNRNLAIGFGILLLLSLSIGMLALTSRRAQRLAHQQMEFVAGVSHELRTPIAVIKSAAENLSQGVVGSPDRVKRYGDAIGSEARRLGEMVEHVIQYSGLESGRSMTAAAPVAAAALVDEALAEATPLLTAAGIHVERQVADDLPPIVGDPVALRSAVHNLIANAVKYGGEDRWLGLHVAQIGERRRAEVHITVEDHGAGIPASDLPHIFEPFYRGADAIGRQVHGNGLGLSIVKRIVTAHGGRIRVTTKAGEGTAFTISLPAADPAAFEGAAVCDTDHPALPRMGNAPARS